MILELRQKHRHIMSAMAAILPIVLIVGVNARRPIPVLDAAPSVLMNSQTADQRLWTRNDLWPSHQILTTLRGASNRSRTIEFAFSELIGPDVLVYWTAGERTPNRRGLPKNAQFLGALADRERLELPTTLQRARGRFVLYSLANQEIVLASELLTLATP